VSGRSLGIVLFAAVCAAGCARHDAPLPRDQHANPPKGAHSKPAVADSAEPTDSLGYIEYRLQPELGQVSIFTGVVDGPKTVKRLESNAEQLLKKGIVVSTGDKTRSLHRVDTLGGRKIDTLILASPPDAEEPEAGWTRRILVSVNGKPKIDCSLGEAPEGNLVVYGIQIFPEDGTVAFTASDSDGHELVVPEEISSLDDPTLITDDDFAEPPDDEPLDERPMPVRV
jgi:hypothetical protein